VGGKLQLGGICSISKKAVFTRFQNCGKWLGWLCEHIYRNNHAIREAPEWLGDRKVYLVDASDEPVHGSDKADYRLHYAIGLFDLGTKRFHVYNRKGRKVNVLGCFKGVEAWGDRGEDAVLRI
jgi:hypothetical protein